MRKKLIFLAVFLLFTVGFGCFGANAQENFSAGNEAIKSFDIQAKIEKNGSVLISETIVYDFGENRRRGIYRDIPIGKLSIKVLGVADESGIPYKYSISREAGNLRIKIGDPNAYVAGIKTYIISYQVRKALGYFEDHDEFYWNATGNFWEIKIEKATAIVILPGGIDAIDTSVSLKCYTGPVGSINQDCQNYFDFNGIANFQTNNSLNPREGLTIFVGWPKGFIIGPSAMEKIQDFFLQFGFWLLPIVVFIFMFQLWWRKGRDIKLNKTIIAQYELPRDLRPAEVGYILNQRFDSQSLSATIVDLAVKGYLKIEETEKKILFFNQKSWAFVKTKDFSSDNSLEPYEKFLLEKIFGIGDRVEVSSLRQKFYKNLKELKTLLSNEMVLDDYFISDPVKTQQKFIIVGAVVLLASYFLVKIISETPGFIILKYNEWVPFAITGILFLGFGAVMPKKTKKGTELLWQIKGFREYIKTAERYRAQFQEKENIFEKFLPYAILFRQTKKWASAFEGISQTPPNWYVSTMPITHFSPTNFTASLDKSLAGMAVAMGATGGGGGGGFSGGGGGGGGGGSW